MPSTEQLVVYLSREALDIARARVASGEFASESEVITQALLDTVLPLHNEPGETLLQECARRYDAMRADRSRGLTEEQTFAFLVDEE